MGRESNSAGSPNRVLASNATVDQIEKDDFKIEGPHRIETKDQRVLETFFIGRGSR